MEKMFYFKQPNFLTTKYLSFFHMMQLNFLILSILSSVEEVL